MNTTITATRKVMETFNTSERRANAIITLMHQIKDNDLIADALGVDVRVIIKIRLSLGINPQDYLEKIVSMHLKNLQVPVRGSGYQYLRFAVLKCLEDPTLISSMLKRLYPAIAEKFHTTWERAERSMRYAIEISRKRCKNDAKTDLAAYDEFIQEKKLPTSEFIALLVDKIKLEYA